MSKKIDLLVPVYNGRPYFEALLSDIKKSEHHFARIIFYDDASQDGSAEYLSGRGLEVICGKENQGQAFARKALLAAASAEYVHFHDMDDPLFESFFDRLAPQLQPSQIGVGRFVADFDRYSIEHHLPPSLDQGILSLEDAYHYFIHLNSVIFPREELLAVGGFRPELRIHEDRFLFFCLANAKIHWQVCKEALARQWCHPKNTSSTMGERRIGVNWIRYFELAFELVPAGDLGFLFRDALRISQDLLYAGELDMAKRGFALCDRLGAKNFPELTPKTRWFTEQFGFYRAYHSRRIYGAGLGLVRALTNR